MWLVRWRRVVTRSPPGIKKYGKSSSRQQLDAALLSSYCSTNVFLLQQTRGIRRLWLLTSWIYSISVVHTNLQHTHLLNMTYIWYACSTWYVHLYAVVRIGTCKSVLTVVTKNKSTRKPVGKLCNVTMTTPPRGHLSLIICPIAIAYTL